MGLQAKQRGQGSDAVCGGDRTLKRGVRGFVHAPIIDSFSSCASFSIDTLLKMGIKDKIRDGRLRLGKTEQQFADAIGVSRGAVQQWEKGTTAPNRKRQPAVAALLGMSVAELMSEQPPAIDMEPVLQKISPPTSRPPPSHGTKPDDSLIQEIVELLQGMSSAGKSEALEYLRYMAKRHNPFFSPDSGPGSGKGDSIPPPAKAA